jgi:hypothetical protein
MGDIQEALFNFAIKSKFLCLIMTFLLAINLVPKVNLFEKNIFHMVFITTFDICNYCCVWDTGIIILKILIILYEFMTNITLINH